MIAQPCGKYASSVVTPELIRTAGVERTKVVIFIRGLAIWKIVGVTK